ncbi:calcium-binding protein [Almyronema epifaneia]|uniref:Right-handed parallel beta-helix repeat-containing protein n=1 Tax=Almyronema epifaneia S1 TaxID=2991925 RepID=A0ABW6ICL4_9CYAN
MNTNSRSYYVSPNGNNKNPGTKELPWKDISYAVSQRSPVKAGDTVLVQSGTYRESITLEKSGNSQQGHINLKANGNVILRDPNPNAGGFREGVIQSAGEGYWVIDGFRIENTSWAGISLRDANNMIVQNNHTYETGASGIIVMPDTYFGGGEAEVTSSNIKILNNTVERANWKWKTSNDQGSPQEALSLWGVDGFEVAGNFVKNTTKEGIDIKTGSRNGSVHNNTVTGTAQISGGYGGYRGGPAIYVDGNRANTFNVDIYNNTVYGNRADGIVIADEVARVGKVSDIRIYNNVVYDNGQQGVNGGSGIGVGHNVEGVEILNNTLSGNVQAIVIGGNLASGYQRVNNVLIRNNIFADSTYRNGYFANVSNVTVDHNLFTDGFSQLYQTGGSISNLQQRQNTAVDSVGFVNADKKDFRLSQSSAAIDRGSNQIGRYAQNALNEVQRPKGGRIDAGAYEFSNSVPAPTPSPSAPNVAAPQESGGVSSSGGGLPSTPTPADGSGTGSPPTGPDQGSVITISGDQDSNLLRGGAEAEQILGLAGNDKIFGNGGDDILLGGNGDDEIRGGLGNDVITGNNGNDVLLGNEGDDNLQGGLGRDRIKGDLGNDVISGDDGSDWLQGGAGDDQIKGGDSNDQLFGDQGDDALFGEGGNDLLRGGAGNDSMAGGEGNDSLFGENGNDQLVGGMGRDRLNGGNDDDELWGDSGDDWLQGGSGNDQIKAGEDSDRLFGEAGDDVLEGGLGRDILKGGSGQDQLIGTDPSAPQVGLAEQDDLIGGSDADTFWLGDATQSFYGSGGDSDYALIHDFRANQGDVIQLHGRAEQYSLGSAPAGQPKGTAIYLNTASGEDLIAVVKGNANLDLASSSFDFV